MGLLDATNMKYILLNAQNVDNINLINKQQTDRQIEVIYLTDKRCVVYYDYLSDEYWSDYWNIFSGQPQIEIDDNSVLFWWNKLKVLVDRDGIVMTPFNQQELYDLYKNNGEL